MTPPNPTTAKAKALAKARLVNEDGAPAAFGEAGISSRCLNTGFVKLTPVNQIRPVAPSEGGRKTALIDLNARGGPTAMLSRSDGGYPVHLHPAQTGLALGSVVAFAHLVWATLVAIGWAQPLLDFVLWLHFLKVPIQLAPFDGTRAALLVAVTFAISGAMGAFFAVVWNRLHGQRSPLRVNLG
jgi:hypothetical protein